MIIKINQLTSTLRIFLKKDSVKIYLWCLISVLIWRLGLEIINQFIGSAVTSQVRPLTGTEYDSSLLRWASWDGGWYQNIVEKGYILKNNLQGPESLAFFPAFPLGTWLIHKITFINQIYSGLILNTLITSFVTFFVYKLTLLLSARKKLKSAYSNQLAKISVALVLLSPPALFFAAFYADALLALGLIGSIYFAYKSNLLLSSLFAALATSSKSIGIVAIPVMLLIAQKESGLSLLGYTRSNFLKICGYTLIAASGLILYMLFLQYRFGDPLLFYKIQEYWESRALPGFFLSTLINVYYRNILHPSYYGGTLGYFYHLNAMLSPIVAAIVAIYVLIKDRINYFWIIPLVVLSTIIPLSAGGTVVSANRYFLLCIVPLSSYVCAELIPRYKKLENSVPYLLYLSSIALFILTASFLSSNFAG